MYGNQMVTSTSIFTVGYVIGQIPSNLLLTRMSPRWVIPTVRAFLLDSIIIRMLMCIQLEVGWGIAVMCMSRVKSYQALYGLRFLVGLFE